MESGRLHLDAAKKLQRINLIIEKVKNNQFEPSIEKEIADAIRFFGKNISKLIENYEAILKIGHVFLFLSDKNFVEWSLRDSNAFLLLASSFLLKRKDETLIRHISTILLEFVSRLPQVHLKSLALLHQKHIGYILHKISKVSTFFTQMKLLNIVKTALKDSNPELGVEVFQRESLVASCNDHIKARILRLFNEVTISNFSKTYRDFLEMYNREVIPMPFICSLNGYLTSVNGKKRTRVEEMKIDFNLRILSISFFIKDFVWKNTKSGSSDNKYFIELEECDVNVFVKHFKNPNHIELKLKPTRSQILDQFEDIVESLPPIESLVLVVDDEQNLFMAEIYDLFKNKTPMAAENLTDNESIISYRTVDTSFDTMKHDSWPPITKRPIEMRTVDSCSIPSSGNIQLQSESLTNSMELSQVANKSFIRNSSQNPLQPIKQVFHTPAETIRQTAKIKPTLGQVPKTESFLERFKKSIPASKTPQLKHTIYDDPPSDESLPPVSQYMSQKRIARKRRIVQHYDENIDPATASAAKMWKPVATSTVMKKKNPVQTKRAAANKSSVKSRAILNQRAIDSSSDDAFETVIENQKAKKPTKLLETKRPAKRAAENKKSSVEIRTSKRQKKVNYSTDDSIISFEATEKTLEVVEEKPLTAINKTQVAVFIGHIPEKVVKEKMEKAFKMPSPIVKSEMNVSSEKENMSTAYKSKIDTKATVTATPKIDSILATSPAPVKLLPKKRVSFAETLYESNQKLEKANDYSASIAKSDLEDSDAAPASTSAPVRMLPIKRIKIDETQSLFSLAAALKNQTAAQQQSNVVFDMGVLEKNKILEMYINDSMSIAQENVNHNDELFDDLIEVRTQTVQKKTSPTQIRTVQIQEINFGTQSQFQSQDILRHTSNTHLNGMDMNHLNDLLESKASEELEPLLQEIKSVREKVHQLKKPETKNDLLRAIADCREKKKNFADHLQEHVKLLKRLYHSKRKMKQTFVESKQSIQVLKTTLKKAVTESRIASNELLQQIEQIKRRTVEKEKEIKSEIWHEHISNLNDVLQQTLLRHRDMIFS